MHSGMRVRLSAGAATTGSIASCVPKQAPRGALGETPPVRIGARCTAFCSSGGFTRAVSGRKKSKTEPRFARRLLAGTALNMASVPHPIPAGWTLDPERRRRRRTMRLRMQSLVATSYGVDATLLLLFHFAGTLPLWVPAAYLAVAVVACALFFLLLASSWPERRNDQNLTGIQMPVAAAVQLTFLLLAPQLGFFFLTILFIVFAFGALRLDPKEASFAWAALAAGLGAVLWQVRGELALPNRTEFEIVLVWASFTLVFGRCVFLGVYGSKLRVSLRKQADELAASIRRIEELASRDELT